MKTSSELGKRTKCLFRALYLYDLQGGCRGFKSLTAHQFFSVFVFRICYDKSDPGKKRVRFSCLGYTAHINEETWKDLDAKILELADEVEGASLNSYA